MISKAEILEEINKIYFSKWREIGDLAFAQSLDEKDALVVDGAIACVSLCGTSDLATNYKDAFSAQVYRSFFVAASHVIRNNGGRIVACGGATLNAVFCGERKCSSSAKAALQVAHIIRELNVSLHKKYPTVNYVVDYRIGIDCGSLFAIKTGIGEISGLAMLGAPVNIASNLAAQEGCKGKILITEGVFERLNEDSKYSGGENSKCMWQHSPGVAGPGVIYESNWGWRFE